MICNCPTLVESLIESELFGYVRGVFACAIQDRPGLFEHADGGTVGVPHERTDRAQTAGH